MIDNEAVDCADCDRSVNPKALTQGLCDECYSEYDPDWAEYQRFEEAMGAQKS